MSKLVNIKSMIQTVFDKPYPTERFIRNQMKMRQIPFKKIGKLVRFDPEEVRATIDKRNSVCVR